MNLTLRLLPVYCWAVLTAAAIAQPLPCVKHGTDRWPVKTTLPASPTKKTMTLDDALKLPRLTDVKNNDARYRTERIGDQPVKEDTLVTLSGWLYLVAFESDDCDFHIQISPQPRTTTNPPTADDNCIIVEVPSEVFATTIASQVSAVRQYVIEKLLKNTPPKIDSVHVMQHPVYVTVTGALFYDDAHEYMADGGTGRGKKKMESKTLWELHPVTSLKITAAPQSSN